MPAATADRLVLLSSHHFPGLTARQQHCLGYFVLSFSDAEASADLDIAAATFHRHVSEASHCVLDPLGLPAIREGLQQTGSLSRSYSPTPQLQG